ncbi:pectin lyase-like superfamily protein [Actinidia rufa]|uniref:Pectin lyase-like superfamily protein n=1 Tax=Actinidia rufa TaxID=165716 RepID=A0A7J0E0I6_9ERIC|nr:pectin lyase-like superfamily protein [Actinidia rufa]
MKMVQPMTYRVLSLLPFLFFLHIQLLPTGATTTYNVVTLGAKGDGKSDSTMPFLSAWDSACGSDHPATVYVPPGTYLLGKTMFRRAMQRTVPSPFVSTALLWPPPITVSSETPRTGSYLTESVVFPSTVEHLMVRARTLEFSNSNNIFVSGLTSLNSQMFHIVINNCNNVKVQGAKVSASGNSPNTDGIHVSSSSGVMILNSRIGTGDDCISIGPGTTNLWIQNIACGPGHGISIGSLGKDLNEAGACSSSTLRWSMSKIPSSSAKITAPTTKNCPDQVSGVRISDVTYQDIHGSSATEVAVEFDCSKEYPCSRITLEDVNLTYENKAAEASCVLMPEEVLLVW